MESSLLLQELCEEIKRKWLTSAPPPSPSPRDIWEEQVLTAYAKSCVLVSDQPRRTHLQVLAYLPPGVRCPNAWQLDDMGGVDAIYRRIARGNLGIEDQLGVWSPDFFHGLRLSGALRRHKGRNWGIWEWSRRELVQDLQEMPFPHKLESKPRPDAMRRLRRCPVSHLPPTDTTSNSVVAGLFAGAVLKEVEGDMWLVLPEEEAVKQLLDDWSVHYRFTGPWRGRVRILVSPFYSVLFAHLMPCHSAARLLNLRGASMCPLLALLYWEMAFADKGRRYLPSPDSLPFGISRRTFHRRHYKRRELHKMAVAGLGIVRVDPRLRELMVSWHKKHQPQPSPIPVGSEETQLSPKNQQA